MHSEREHENISQQQTGTIKITARHHITLGEQYMEHINP